MIDMVLVVKTSHYTFHSVHVMIMTLNLDIIIVLSYKGALHCLYRNHWFISVVSTETNN